ncbi:MAG TPA: DNA internalization-related competence protein ComEC/Rec2, partial [Oceanospirillales bacterium]|nr:DNA internalization-related competence protein ComEC/Rec2 [Oceanospirillales bacterium]
MLILTISFLVGISQMLWLPRIDLSWLIVSVLVILFCLSYLFVKKKTIIKIILAVAIGFSYGLLCAYFVKSHQLQFIPEENIGISAQIINLPKITQQKAKFLVKVIKIDDNLKKKITTKKLLVSWYDDFPKLEVGQVWNFELKLKPNHSYQNPASYDYSKWLFRHQIDATATVKKAQFIGNKSNLFVFINQLRQKIAQIINSNIASQRVQALLIALSIGDKSHISFKDSTLFAETGTAHLIAISGLHVGLIAFVGVIIANFLFFLFPSERFNRIKLQAIMAILFALFYAVLAGLSIPTMRAFIMVAVFSFAHVNKTQITRWQAWSVALFIILLIDPLSVLDAGFWFSFAAVALLMFAFNGRKLAKNKFILFFQAQIVILIGLMPLMIIVFHKINLLTPLANLLVLPLASLILIPLLLTSLFCSFLLPFIANFMFVLLEKVTLAFFAILDYLQNFSYLSLNIVNLNTIALLGLMFFSLILLLPRLVRFKYLAVFLLIPLFIKPTNNLQKGEFIVNVLDVGQGLSIFIQTKNHSIIYDTGAKFDSGFSLA